MSILTNVICPVSNVKIDSNVSRLSVFFISLLLALYILTGWWPFVAYAAFDYGLRAFNYGKWSPLKRLSQRIATAFAWEPKMIDEAQKVFASRLGFGFTVATLILYPISVPTSMIVCGILLLFSLLDSVANFCVGCLTYNYLVLPFYTRSGRLV